MDQLNNLTNSVGFHVGRNSPKFVTSASAFIGYLDPNMRGSVPRMPSKTKTHHIRRWDNAAHDRLHSLLHQAITRGRDANNRELLWVRLTLTDMLRKYNRFDEAATLFADIVKPASGDSDSNQCLGEERDTPRQLAIAEEALRHVRRASAMEADTLLYENKLEWVRTQDFWIVFGGPITDTASMKGPE